MACFLYSSLGVGLINYYWLNRDQLENYPCECVCFIALPNRIKGVFLPHPAWSMEGDSICPNTDNNRPNQPYLTPDTLSTLQLPFLFLFFYFYPIMYSVCTPFCITLMERVIEVALNNTQHSYLQLFSAETVMCVCHGLSSVP